jgi:cell division protein FtsB
MKKEMEKSARLRGKLKSSGALPFRNAYLFIALALLVYLTVYFGSLHYQNFIFMERELAKATAEQRLKEKTINEKEEEKAKLQDPDYVVKIAREDLYIMKKNEVPIIMIPGPAAASDNQKRGESEKKRGKR